MYSTKTNIAVKNHRLFQQLASNSVLKSFLNN